MIAKRTRALWVAVCDCCHADGLHVAALRGATRAEREAAFADAARVAHLFRSSVPANDGKWLCSKCAERQEDIP